MSLKLYELSQDFQELLSMLDAAGGPEEEAAIEAKMAALEGDIGLKVDNCCAVVATLEAEARALKDEEERLAARRGAYEANALRLKEYVKRELIACQMERSKGARFTAAIQKNPPKCVIDDEAAVPSTYWLVVTEKKLDKATLLSDLKVEGCVVPGAHVEQTSRLAIR